MKKLWNLGVAVALGMLSATSHAEVLDLDAYLGQVRQGHLGVKAAGAAAEGARARKEEGELLFAPQLFAETQWLQDRKPPVLPSQGNETIGGIYRLGVQGQSPFGLKARLFTEVDYIHLKNASPFAIPQNRFHEGRQTLELSQSLWRNRFGSETRATETLARAAAEAKFHGEKFRERVLLAGAEVAYWRLAAAREIVAVKEESLERARKVRAWNQRRETLDLGKRTDLLQAEAAVKLVELDLQAARDEERMARWAFNNARGVDSETVPETLRRLSEAPERRMERPAPREDVQAAEHQLRAAQAQAELSVEKNRPNLELTAQVSLNGRDSRAAEAWRDSLTTNRATYGAGVRFTVPLRFGLVDAVAGGYRREAVAAEMDYGRKRFEEARDWDNLGRKLDEARRRLELAVAIEAAQKEKWVQEKRRHDFGKTTTFQVLSFEQDLASSQLNRIRLHGDVLTLLAQMTLFGGTR